METVLKSIKLTSFSHGAGCGCKIAPAELDRILAGVTVLGNRFPGLLVGNSDRDDAAVLDLGDGTAIISTTDFFMPIVDDPLTFGKIAAANAISDIYAMGGSPLLAIAILGWPVNLLGPEIAGRVIEGAQLTCLEANIPLAGGHSIDSPEPIFGLAVTGRIAIKDIKKNGGAFAGDVIYLTKPIGTGILSTAQKKGLISDEHESVVKDVMVKLNVAGERLGKINGVHAMTDVTGFGLGGHLVEMCKASNTTAVLSLHQIPLIIPELHQYIADECVPGGTNRNFESYGSGIRFKDEQSRFIICDPQTSGGLLISVDPDCCNEVEAILKENGVWFKPIGLMQTKSAYWIECN